MEKKTIVLMIVTIVAFFILIAGMCYGFFFSANKEQEKNEITQEVNAENVQEESNVIEEEEEEENITETPNNVSENVTVEEPVVQNVPDTSSQIIGKEEAESASENAGLTEEEKAIELVKEKWGAQDTSVAYAVANREGNIYMISVTNKETTAVLAWYQVNMENGEVVQQ